MGTVTYSLLRVGSTVSAVGVWQRMDTLSKWSRHWQRACGVPKLGANPGEGCKTSRKKRRKRAGADTRAEGEGEKGLLKECWGDSKTTPVHHTSAPWGCPLFHDDRDRHPYISRATSALDRDLAGCDAPFCP